MENGKFPPMREVICLGDEIYEEVNASGRTYPLSPQSGEAVRGYRLYREIKQKKDGVPLPEDGLPTIENGFELIHLFLNPFLV